MVKNCGYAIASLVLGIVGAASCIIPGLGFVGLICGVLAIIFSVVAKNAIENSNGQLTGRGMAKAGMILGIITIGLDILFMVACASLLGAMHY